jgi:glycerol-3-phosphate dehydrogenase
MKRPALNDLQAKYDLIVVGGGITGAGILLEATRGGARTLLLDRGDFACGASSGSSKLVHGGLRYLKSGQWRLTRESVQERQRLLREAPDIVEAQEFMMPVYRGARPGKLALKVGLWLYDRMAGGAARSHWIEPGEARELEPQIRRDGLLGAMLYEDARTNDARLVLSLIVESCNAGAQARNYTEVTGLLRGEGRVRGVAVRDAGGTTREVEAGVVVDATGPGAGRLQGDGAAPKLRPLRGSHFIFAPDRLPVGRAVSWLHPRDRRPVFAYPWEGVTLYGTTDVDHDGADGAPPRMRRDEADYLIEGLAHQFPELNLQAADALSAYSAVRPVVAGGKADPSAESRESTLWSAPGLVGVTGGKLTTFRLTAREALREAARQHQALAPPQADATMFHAPTSTAMRTQTRSTEDIALAGTRWSLAKLRYSVRHEQVVHLDDLMLRRSRLGLVTPGGGRALLSKVQPVLREELGWSDAQWQGEERRYLELWARDHAPVPAG